jgi:hypothetical protein
MSGNLLYDLPYKSSERVILNLYEEIGLTPEIIVILSYKCFPKNQPTQNPNSPH